MDKTLLFLINREWTNPALDVLMATVTNFSVFLPFIVAGAALLWWRGGFRDRSFVVATACILASPDGVFTQVPAGLLVDGTRAKRLLIVASGLLVATGCLLIVVFPQFYAVVAALVSYSRVYCWSLWPSDVFISAALGLVFAWSLLEGFAVLYQMLGSRFFTRFHAKHPRLVPASCG